jgi:hypothetical protein
MPATPQWMKSDPLMWAMVVSCVATPLVMLSWFYKKKWL